MRRTTIAAPVRGVLEAQEAEMEGWATAVQLVSVAPSLFGFLFRFSLFLLHSQDLRIEQALQRSRGEFDDTSEVESDVVVGGVGSSGYGSRLSVVGQLDDPDVEAGDDKQVHGSKGKSKAARAKRAKKSK